MTVYFDGEKAGSAENTGNVCPKDLGETTRNWLGRSQWTQDAYCDHIYDDFRIYDYAIQADDVKTLFDDKEISTSIIQIENKSDFIKNDAVYDLMGRKVSTSTKDISRKGIYIQNGKKFVVK